LMPYLSGIFQNVLGVDWSPSMVALSTRYLQQHPGCIVLLGDGYTLPFRDKMCDFVYSVTCFQHMEELAMIQSNLKEAYRVLRPEGSICVQTVPGMTDGKPTGDGYPFETVQAIEHEFMSAGFTDVAHRHLDQWIWITGRKEL